MTEQEILVHLKNIDFPNQLKNLLKKLKTKKLYSMVQASFLKPLKIITIYRS